MPRRFPERSQHRKVSVPNTVSLLERQRHMDVGLSQDPLGELVFTLLQRHEWPALSELGSSLASEAENACTAATGDGGQRRGDERQEAGNVGTLGAFVCGDVTVLLGAVFFISCDAPCDGSSLR
jgi:hypothetical protein